MIYKQLYQAILLLKTPDEVEKFLKDLCTPKEIADMAERFNVATILATQELSYQQIHNQTGISIATIGRVARFLKQENNKGYEIIISRMREKNEI